MANPNAQPNRRPTIFLGGYSEQVVSFPSEATKAKVEAFKAKYPNTEIYYGVDGYVCEIINHDGLRYEASSSEELMERVLNDAEMRDLCELDTPGAITAMSYLGTFSLGGNLGVSIESQQIHRNRLAHNNKFCLNANDNGDGSWSVWRIVDTTEVAPVDTTARLTLSKKAAIRRAEQIARERLGITDQNIRCELAEEEGGYQVQLNLVPNDQVLRPIQRISLNFVAPGALSLAIPVQVIIDSQGDGVFGRHLNCDIAAKGFVIEPKVKTAEQAALLVRAFEIDASRLRVDPKTGRRMLADDELEIYYDPNDKGNANQILLEKADGTGFTYELGTVEFAAVCAYFIMRRCLDRHRRTGSPRRKVLKVYVGLERLLGQRITDNAAYYPSAGVIGFGIRVRGVGPKGRHFLVLAGVGDHEFGHYEKHQNQRETGKQITGTLWMGADENLSDGDAYAFGNEDIIEFGSIFGKELTFESIMSDKGELAVLAFGAPIRVMENEWKFPINESAEEHDIAEQLDAPYIHTAKAWVAGEYKKLVNASMTEAEKKTVLHQVVHTMDDALVTINKTVPKVIKENRPNCIEFVRTLKLIARRNYGADVEAYFTEGYNRRHGIPEKLESES